MAFVVFNLLAAAALIGIDQAIKLWATNVLQPIGAMPLIPHVVELRFVLNRAWRSACSAASSCSSSSLPA